MKQILRKLIILSLSFWKPWVESYTAWYELVFEPDQPGLFWFDLNFFTEYDYWDYYTNDSPFVNSVLDKLL